MSHKAGFVNIIGNPNVGKSTLMNAFVGERLSIITSKAQTTRHRILGIVNGDDFQVILSDTPGIIKPAYEMQESMMNFVKSAFEDADILIYMVEIGEQALKDETFFKKIIHAPIPVLLLLNKIDKSNQEQLEEQIDLWKSKVPNAEIFPISALENFNVKEVFAKYDIANDKSFNGHVAMVMGVFYKKNNEWKFNAIGDPIKDKKLEQTIQTVQQNYL